MSFRLWEIIKDPDKRAILSWLGAGAVVVCGGIWTALTFVVEHKDASDKKGGTNITVSGQGIVSGRDTNITGPSKEQIAQIQKPLTEQLGLKDAQIMALTKLLLEKNPVAGPGAQQTLGAAVGSIAQGAAEGDTRLQQALDFLKENKIAEATRLLNAIAKDKTALAEQAATPTEKDRKDAAIAYRNLGAIAGLLPGHALLIGVSNYTNGWDQLPSVKDDLHDLMKGLQPFFETVETVQSPTVAEIRTKLHNFLLGQWNKPNERLFIYYSGHGFTDFNQNSQQNDGYITGSDTPLYNQIDGRAVENAVQFGEVDSWSRETKARHVLMVFDSCFGGSFFQTIMTEPGQNDLDSVRQLLRNPVRYTKAATTTEPSQNDLDAVRRLLGKPIRYYITACRQTEQVSADGTFAKLLLRGLRGGADFFQRGVISAEELGSYLFHEVPKYSPRPQTPQYKSIGNAKLSEGQFFFLTGPAAP